MQYKSEGKAIPMGDIIAAIIITVVVGGASYYIWKSKKRGQKCIGCPYSGCEKCKCKK